MFLGYSMNSKAYRIYNMRTQTIIESVNVVVDDTNDLFEFSKEQLIFSLIDDTDEDQTVEISDKSSANPCDSIATVYHVATETDQAVSTRKNKDGSKDVLTNRVRK